MISRERLYQGEKIRKRLIREHRAGNWYYERNTGNLVWHPWWVDHPCLRKTRCDRLSTRINQLYRLEPRRRDCRLNQRIREQLDQAA